MVGSVGSNSMGNLGLEK